MPDQNTKTEGRLLALCADMFGCPNRCLHCWLSHMPNRRMEEGADEWIVDLFRPYFADDSHNQNLLQDKALSILAHVSACWPE